MTLLQKAKQIRKRKPYSVYKNYTVEDLELVNAWLGGEISVGDVCVAIGKDRNQSPSGYTYIALVIRNYVREKKFTKIALKTMPAYFYDRSKVNFDNEKK